MAVNQEMWEEYIAFTETTVIYNKDHEAEYVRRGELSEFGEVQGVAAKVIRDNDCVWTEEKLLCLKKELGDLLYMWARIDSMNGVSDVKEVLTDFREVLCDLPFLKTEDFPSMDECLYMNREKLQSRKARGVLGGSGDDR